VEAELIGDDWGYPDRQDWESMPARSDQDQPSGDPWGFTPGLSYEDRIRTVLFDAGTRRLEAPKAAQLAMAEILEALQRGHGILSISEMSLRGIAPRHLQGP
jgi:hypothetical protein